MKNYGGLKKKKIKERYRNEIAAYMIIAIPLLWWMIFFLYPFFRTVFLSFSNWSMMEDFALVGFSNYIEMFHDDLILCAFRNTLVWCVIMLIGTNGFGLLLAFLLTNMKNKVVEKFFLVMLYWPSLVSAVVGSAIQLSLFGSDELGIINNILIKFGILNTPVAWFQDVRFALYSLMIFPFFFGFGMKLLLYYVGIKNISDTYNEAAELETSSKIRIFFSITLPLLMPIIILNIVLSVIDGFKVIAPMQLIIPAVGGPERETTSVVYALYREAFEKSGNRVGYASAISMVLFLIILIISIIQLKLERGEGSYE